MVKRLLIVVAAMIAFTGSYAQKVQQTPLLKNARIQRNISCAMQNGKVAEPTKAGFTHALDETPFWYERPKGCYYIGFNEEGNGYGPIILAAPIAKEVSFPYHYTKAGKAKMSWEMRYPNADTTFVVSEWDSKEDSAFIISGIGPNTSYALPTMIYGVNEFNFGEANYYYTQDPTNYYGRFGSRMDVEPFSNFNDHDGNATKYYGWSDFNNNHYLFGTGTITEQIIQYDPITGDSIGVEDVDCPIPNIFMSMGETNGPLYIQNAFMDMLSFSQNPIPEGMVITMVLYNPNTGEKYGEMTCSADDIQEETWNDQFPLETDYGTLYGFSASFANWVEDEFGTLEPEPFTVDGPWAVSITGLNQEGVDVGFFGANNNTTTGDDLLPPGRMTVIRPDTVISYRYSTSLGIHVNFNAIYDYVEVIKEDSIQGEGYTALNTLKISDDGATCTNLEYPALGGAVLFTATPWYGYTYDENYYYVFYTKDDEMDAQYELTDMPEWITDVTADVTNWDNESGNTGYTTLTVTCEPLPAETTTRIAECYIQGRGYTSEYPVVIVQGDVTGINSVVASNMAENNVRYNLAGMRVNKDYKGIVIANGKKIMAY